MRPDQRWFPTSRMDRAAWFQNFSAQFAVAGPLLGFTQAEIDAVAADNAMVQFAAAAIVSLEGQMAAVRSFERAVTMGDDDGSQSNFPSVGLAAPPPMVNTGIFERLERLVRRIRVAPAFTPSIGSQLGITRAGARKIDIDSYVPQIKAKPAADPYTFTVRCPVKSFHGFFVSYRRENEGTWQTPVRFMHSPATCTITPANPGFPEQIAVRVQMGMRNKPVGLYSQAEIVTVNP